MNFLKKSSHNQDLNLILFLFLQKEEDKTKKEEVSCIIFSI